MMLRQLPLAWVVLAGCALTSKSAPLELRYFTPEVRDASVPQRRVTASHPRVRIGRISPGALLRDRIMVRTSPVELSPYETLRWTEPPDRYVRRALVRTLFDDQPLAQAVGGAQPILDIEVLAFEEVPRRDGHRGRVVLRYELHDDRDMLAAGTVAVERRAKSADISDVVAAIGQALDEAAQRIAIRVAADVATPVPQ
ncbi:MAG TPA: ABC-type transport auxiliary lipoprotein family protein [Kofleriaceae bacterium]|nr:ABC-type transport auxiliary lipoprotein family protein [Kofleriaceae bacterium]